VPHAGPIYSGPCAAHLYASLDPSIQRVIVLGVDHRGHGDKASLSPWDLWRTPLGDVRVDDGLSVFLADRLPFIQRQERAHALEHSIEIQLLFLQRTLSEFTFLPISLSYLSTQECADLGAAIADACQDAKAKNHKLLILASSDLNHYLSPKQTAELDRLALNEVLALDPTALLRVVEAHNISMCGVLPSAVMLFAARKLGAKRAHLLKHYDSGAVMPMRKVVGYASVAVEQ
jgi:AmmeMemoRadiSam system protein B